MTEPSRDPTCLFCRIIAGEIPATVLAENAAAIAIADSNPQAPLHALAIPRRHIASVASMTVADAAVVAGVLLLAQQVAAAAGKDATGYRLIINHGHDAGQSVGHLHVHVLGGRSLQWPPG